MILLLSFILILIMVIKKYWENWKIYHSTLLYISLCNVFQNWVSANFHLWKFHPVFIQTHEFTGFLLSFIALPSLTLIYLCHFFKKETLEYHIKIYIFWVLCSTVIQFIMFKLKLITYHHGYQFWMEPFFYLVMYAFLPLHHKKPLLTYVLSGLIATVLLICFHVPIED